MSRRKRKPLGHAAVIQASLEIALEQARQAAELDQNQPTAPAMVAE